MLNGDCYVSAYNTTARLNRHGASRRDPKPLRLIDWQAEIAKKGNTPDSREFVANSGDKACPCLKVIDSQYDHF